MSMSSSLFSDITHSILVVVYRRFGTGSPLAMGPVGYPQTLLNNCIHTLPNIPEERRRELHRGGSMTNFSFLFHVCHNFAHTQILGSSNWYQLYRVHRMRFNFNVSHDSPFSVVTRLGAGLARNRGKIPVKAKGVFCSPMHGLLFESSPYRLQNHLTAILPYCLSLLRRFLL